MENTLFWLILKGSICFCAIFLKQHLFQRFHGFSLFSFLEDKINVQKESQMNKYDLKYLDWIDLDLNSNSDLDWLSYV